METKNRQHFLDQQKGGTCTLISTSTNLIVYGLLIQETATGSLGIFEPTLIGLPLNLIVAAITIILVPMIWPL